MPSPRIISGCIQLDHILQLVEKCYLFSAYTEYQKFTYKYSEHEIAEICKKLNITPEIISKKIAGEIL